MKIDFDLVLKALKEYDGYIKECIIADVATSPQEAVAYLRGKRDATKQIKTMLKRLVKKNGGDL